MFFKKKINSRICTEKTWNLMKIFQIRPLHSREKASFFCFFFIPERVQRVGGGISEVLDVNQITFFSVLGWRDEDETNWHQPKWRKTFWAVDCSVKIGRTKEIDVITLTDAVQSSWWNPVGRQVVFRSFSFLKKKEANWLRLCLICNVVV